MGYEKAKEYAPITSFRMQKRKHCLLEEKASKLGISKGQLIRYLVDYYLSGKIDLKPDNIK